MPSHEAGQAAFAAAVMQRVAPTDLAPLGVTAVGDLDRRFAVYRNTFAHSLTEALAARFPTVQRLVGADFFRAMAAMHVTETPPDSPVLQTYGTAFPAFLRRFPPVAHLPYLADVATVEVLRGQAYHAADATPLTPDAVQAALVRDPQDAVLTLHPGLRVVHTDHGAVSVWRCNQPGAVPAPVAPAPEAALIFRHAGNAVVLPVATATAAAVAALAAGTPLGRVPEVAIATALPPLLRHALILRVTAANPKGTS
ncbi:Putative DNA-binding domain-containing protein [Loktanella fryxellensis]|uniref:Putative DNA-binding domain-containing protein n=1 Tax=Loktanella fryxellensis TaxID=245187 RepID=A0A1H8C0B1_9RHOB|nr:DNA-binding domain-containing protein [Loktanella fryxellensis]SEM88442.1 Putative DNA-binding domain-containing protein [Loktanella fryxellensis]